MNNMLNEMRTTVYYVVNEKAKIKKLIWEIISFEKSKVIRYWRVISIFYYEQASINILIIQTQFVTSSLVIKT